MTDGTPWFVAQGVNPTRGLLLDVTPLSVIPFLIPLKLSYLIKPYKHKNFNK